MEDQKIEEELKKSRNQDNIIEEEGGSEDDVEMKEAKKN